MTRAQSRRLGLECAALCAELAQMVPEGVIHVAIEACYPLDRVREALVHAGRLGGPARSCFFPIWGCWMPRATVFLTFATPIRTTRSLGPGRIDTLLNQTHVPVPEMNDPCSCLSNTLI